MGDIIGWIFVALTILGFGYALVWQIRDASKVKRSTKWESSIDKRKLTGHYLMVVSLAGFFVSYLLNISVGILAFIQLDFVQPSLINSNSTGFACFLFLAIYFISRFAIVPKEEQGLPLLKAKI